MTKELIIQELHKLSITERLFVLEQTIKDMRLQKENALATAVEQLYSDYQTDESLTAFTVLDDEPLYETR